MLAAQSPKPKFLHRDLSCSHRRQVRLASVLLLAGSVRPTPLQIATGRQAIGLPIDAHHTLLDIWQNSVSRLASEAQVDRLRLRVLVDSTSSTLPVARRPDRMRVEIERDPVELRGTGGLLRDVALGVGDPDDFLLVTNSAQLPVKPLWSILDDLAGAGADVVIVGQEDRSPTSIVLIRRRCLELIPDVGFIDLKEQAMATIAKQFRVAVLRVPLLGIPIRTLDDYVRALRWHHTPARNAGPFGEQWSPVFSLVEHGAVVSAGAEILDSVVLDGGRVEAGAVVVRSVVCPGAVVRRGSVVTDALITRAKHLQPTVNGEARH